MTNAELKLQMKEYENEYETLKNKINAHVERLKELDVLYLKNKQELIKRKSL